MILWIIWYCLNILFSKPHTITYRKPKSKLGFKSRRKPRWVINRIIEHKAIMNKDGCRKIAASFNRRFDDKETVSKSWVATTVRKHRYDILQLRKKLKNRIPKPQAINQVWGVDLSGKQDYGKNTHHMLGIVDHGSRFNLIAQSDPK